MAGSAVGAPGSPECDSLGISPGNTVMNYPLRTTLCPKLTRSGQERSPLMAHAGDMTAVLPSQRVAPTNPSRPSLRGILWRVAEAVATPVLPHDYLALIAPLRAGADLRGRVVSVTPETGDASTVRIRPGRGWRGHVPGQYIRIGVDVDGVRNWRAYSLTSPVDAPDGLISITVKAIPDGKVSNHVVRALQPGTLVHLDQATGDFTLPSPRPARALFVTAGSGVTPVMGMLRNHLDELQDVVVIHS